MMFPDNDTPGVLSMLNSQSLVDKFVDESEKSTLTIEEIVCYLVMKPDAEQMEVDPPQEGTENIEGHGEEVKTTQSWPEAMPKVCYWQTLSISLSIIGYITIFSFTGLDSYYRTGPN